MSRDIPPPKHNLPGTLPHIPQEVKVIAQKDINEINIARAKKRKKLLKISIPVTALVLVLSFLLMFPTLMTNRAIEAYEDNDPSGSLSKLSLIKYPNLYEKYKYHLNTGDAHYLGQDYILAEKSFRRAQKLVPKKHFCKITINLILSLEAQADAFSTQKKYDEAADLYDEIIKINDETKCAENSSENAASEKMQEASDRAEEKKEKNEKQQNDESNNDGDGDEESRNPDEPSQDQQDQLQESNQNSQRERSKDRLNTNTNYDYNSSNNDGRNW